jgi:sarcosine oxidase subunit beta
MGASVGPQVNGRRPDVIVIGGGVVGCSIAYRLAERGRRVLLLERRGLASGASGRNGGMTGAGSAMYTTLPAGRAAFALTTANLATLRQIPDELGVDIELRLPGTLDVITTPEQHAHLVAAVAEQQAAGVKVELLDSQQARALMPSLAPSILGASFAVERGHLWPFALVHTFAAAARRHGAEIRTETSVERLLRRGDRVVGAVAAGEAIEAEETVLATNAYTPHLLPELPPGAIVPARGQILVTQPLPPIVPRPFGTNFDKEYGRQTPEGQILCGGVRRLDTNQGLGTEEERTTPAVLAGIARCLVELFPILRRGEVRVARAWAGIMGFTADGLPLIGRLPGTAGLFVAAGFNGGGFSWAAQVGHIVGDELTGRDHGFEIAPFAPDRFASQGTAWSNPFTTGERDVPAEQPAAATTP